MNVVSETMLYLGTVDQIYHLRQTKTPSSSSDLSNSCSRTHRRNIGLILSMASRGAPVETVAVETTDKASKCRHLGPSTMGILRATLALTKTSSSRVDLLLRQ